jgi:alginate O-acetyltransferase complex protein AlgI
MLFNTTTFLVFFAVFCSFYFSVNETRTRLWIVLLFSNIFYGWWSWKYLALIWLTIFVDFNIAKRIAVTANKTSRKRLLLLSIVTNLGVLAFFKYFNFFVSTLEIAGVGNADWNIFKNIVLPAGLSFYTFQSISYTVDVYRRKQNASQSLLEYSAFVCYFPQLVAGPIERAGHLIPMILAPVAPTRERISSGLFLFSLGFFRKSFADLLAKMVDSVFADLNSATPAAIVFAVLGFGIQIYLDFSGYTDMARGISRIMGVDLMINFRTPYFSLSAKEFWRRWHISLSQWLRDYLYIPLGGNRLGEIGHLRNLMITMLLGGLWHGAGFNFLIWGVLHGFYLCVHSNWMRLSSNFPKAPPFFRWPLLVISWFLTWVAVNYAWLYFRAFSLDSLVLANRKIIEWLLDPKIPMAAAEFKILLIFVIFLDAIYRLRENKTWEIYFSRVQWMRDLVAGFLFSLGFILTVGIPVQQFIYFSF